MAMSQAASIPMNQTPLMRASGNTAAPQENSGLPKSILSVDLGRTSTKTSISRDPGSVVFIPANVKHLSMEQVQGGAFEARATDPLSDIWMVYQGSGYAMGQLAEDFGANLGVGQSKVNDALVKVLEPIRKVSRHMNDTHRGIRLVGLGRRLLLQGIEGKPIYTVG